MTRPRGRTGRPWVRARRRCLAQGDPCYICGRLIDYTLPYRDPWTHRVNLWSASAHHPIPLNRGGHPYHIEAAHLKCNRDIADRIVARANPVLTTSRDW